MSAVAFAGLSLASTACGDSTGPERIPANAMNGVYLGSLATADIRVQVNYLVPSARETCSLKESLFCLFTPDTQGTGSITLRGTGEVQQFTLSGLQGGGSPFLVFVQPSGVMRGASISSGRMSADGSTLQGYIKPGAEATKPSIFGDSAAITFVRQ